MKQKSKFRRFWNLDHRKSDGFTLIELIVVIAIMAILGGVGTAGYGGYIKASNMNADRVTVSNIRRALETANNTYMESFTVANQYEAGLQLPVGYIILSNEPINGDSCIVTVAPGTAEKDASGNWTSSGVDKSADSALGRAVAAAYGNNYASTVQLKYDGWNGAVNGSFFLNANSMIGSVNTMGDKVLGMLEGLGKLNLFGQGLSYNDGKLTLNLLWSKKEFQVLTQDYNDSADLMLSFAEKVSEVDKTTFINGWDSVDSEGAAFGLNAAGREHYSAARAAYNSCFSSYVKSKGNSPTIGGTTYTHDANAHAASIEGHGEDGVELVKSQLGGAASYIPDDFELGVNFPQAVCGSVLQGGVDNSSDYKTCSACSALLSEYKSSDQDKRDAEDFYDTMTTGATMGDAIYDENNPNPEEFFDWMGANSDVFADMYTEANNYANGKSTITMVVTYDTDAEKLDVTVAPLDADSRSQE